MLWYFQDRFWSNSPFLSISFLFCFFPVVCPSIKIDSLFHQTSGFNNSFSVRYLLIFLFVMDQWLITLVAKKRLNHQNIISILIMPKTLKWIKLYSPFWSILWPQKQYSPWPIFSCSNKFIIINSNVVIVNNNNNNNSHSLSLSLVSVYQIWPTTVPNKQTNERTTTPTHPFS